MSPSANVLVASKAPTNNILPLELASTKWNFLNFKPGLVGGHCIGVDPYYLTHKAKMVGHTPRVILAGRELTLEILIGDLQILLKSQVPLTLGL